jgi:HlyD family secretion protein
VITQLSIKESPKLSVRTSLFFGIGLIVMMLLGLFTWSSLVVIASAVISQGRVETQINQQVVQHPEGGVVANVFVKDSDLVSVGDLLLRLDGSYLSTELKIVESQYFELLARKGRLEAERGDLPKVQFASELLSVGKLDSAIQQLIDGQENLFVARKLSLAKTMEQLHERQIQIDNQILGIDAQLKSLNTQIELIRKELSSQKFLFDDGLTISSKLLSLQREEASLSGKIGELQSSRALAQARQTEINVETLRMQTQYRVDAETELRDTGFRILEFAERRRALQLKIQQLDIRAPSEGIIHAMNVKAAGSVVRAAEPILFLIPKDQPLIVSSRVSPADIDQVKIGAEVEIRFTALGARETPQLLGKVTQISPDTLTDKASGAVYYKATIELSDVELAKLGDGKLVQGMPAEVFIRTGATTPLAYLTKPLSQYFSKAWREN